MMMIFQKIGTLNQSSCLAFAKLLHFKQTFPQWRRRDWEDTGKTCETVGFLGTDLVDKLLDYDPETRISANEALQQPYLEEVVGVPAARGAVAVQVAQPLSLRRS